uniref:Uncharacterized protein n=1 Tax=Arundo donax TaxID=35708 RepID=A0A0A8ZMB5_ARUDO
MWTNSMGSANQGG